MKVDGRIHCFINCLYTVQNLCECSSLAVRMSIEDSIPEVLITSLHTDKFPAHLVLAAGNVVVVMLSSLFIITKAIYNTGARSNRCGAVFPHQLICTVFIVFVCIFVSIYRCIEMTVAMECSTKLDVIYKMSVNSKSVFKTVYY